MNILTTIDLHGICGTAILLYPPLFSACTVVSCFDKRESGYCKRTLAVVLSLRARRGQVSLQVVQVPRFVSVRPAVHF